MIKLNRREIKPTIFPDKTSQVWNISNHIFLSYVCDVEWIFESEAELMHLVQLKHLLDENKTRCNLYMPYLPYARQDKSISNKNCFALHSFAKIINSLNFSFVSFEDPHSNLAEKIILNSKAQYPLDMINESCRITKCDLIFYPDEGALFKYSPMLSFESIWGKKVRDQATGNILSYEIVGDPKDKVILIVDDICDGGATFINAATLLYEKGAKEVHLYVSHGIFSKGTRILRDAGIKRIFTKEG